MPPPLVTTAWMPCCCVIVDPPVCTNTCPDGYEPQPPYCCCKCSDDFVPESEHCCCEPCDDNSHPQNPHCCCPCDDGRTPQGSPDCRCCESTCPDGSQPTGDDCHCPCDAIICPDGRLPIGPDCGCCPGLCPDDELATPWPDCACCPVCKDNKKPSPFPECECPPPDDPIPPACPTCLPGTEMISSVTVDLPGAEQPPGYFCCPDGEWTGGCSTNGCNGLYTRTHCGCAAESRRLFNTAHFYHTCEGKAGGDGERGTCGWRNVTHYVQRRKPLNDGFCVMSFHVGCCSGSGDIIAQDPAATRANCADNPPDPDDCCEICCCPVDNLPADDPFHVGTCNQCIIRTQYDGQWDYGCCIGAYLQRTGVTDTGIPTYQWIVNGNAGLSGCSGVTPSGRSDPIVGDPITGQINCRAPAVIHFDPIPCVERGGCCLPNGGDGTVIPG